MSSAGPLSINRPNPSLPNEEKKESSEGYFIIAAAALLIIGVLGMYFGLKETYTTTLPSGKVVQDLTQAGSALFGIGIGSLFLGLMLLGVRYVRIA